MSLNADELYALCLTGKGNDHFQNVCKYGSGNNFNQLDLHTFAHDGTEGIKKRKPNVMILCSIILKTLFHA